MANRCWKGMRRVSCVFTVGGTATDPTTVTLKVKNPSKEITPYTYALGQVIKSVTGSYYKDIDIDIEGTWFYSWIGTGACGAVAEGFFNVDTFFG